jgi:hypothetical protein
MTDCQHFLIDRGRRKGVRARVLKTTSIDAALRVFAILIPVFTEVVVERNSRRNCPHGSRTPHGIGLDCVELCDGRFGVAQGRSGNPRRHERARSPKLVIGDVAEPTKGFERKANPLEVGIGRINELEPDISVHPVARWQRETPAPKRSEHFVKQCVRRPSDA